ncbi:MAG: tRNA lysidine(34) synthetase TilS, partial [Steroidobacterales bacterium]
RKRWPSIAANAARSARHMAEAQGLLDAVAEHDWMRARDGARLEVAGLMGLEPGRAANLVRFWIRRFGHNLPSAQNLERLLAMMTGAASDSTPCVRWPGTAVRRYRGRLYISQAGELAAPGEMEWNWTARRSLALGAGLGSLSMTAGPGPATLAQDRLPKLLSLRAGTGGESLRPSPGARQRSLRNLYQEAGVVPWLRKSIPHLCAGRELIAVGNLWSDARYQPQEGETAIHVEWRDGPELF